MTFPAHTPPHPWLDSSRILQRLDWHGIFGNDNPVTLELGAGDGTFLLGMAQMHPAINFLAVERLLGRATKIAKGINKLHLSNARILRLESAYVLQWLCPPASLESIYILFPDPWPKRKHWKNRLIQTPFLPSAWNALKPGGQLRFATDHEDYFLWTQQICTSQPGWLPATNWNHAMEPKTDFQLAFEAEGRSVFRLCLQKTSC